MIPYESISDAELESSTITTVLTPMQDMAVTLVGERGEFGGMGGEFEVFETGVVQEAVPEVQANAQGGATKVQEGNWFRGVSKAEAGALADLADDALHGIYALGNAVGYSGDNYDATDRVSYSLMDDIDTRMDKTARDGIFPGAV